MLKAIAITALPARLVRAVRHRVAGARAARRRRATAAVIQTGSALHGKVTLITGAGRGIGLTLALAFARGGAQCIILTLEPDEAAAARSTFGAEGLPVEVYVADVSDADQIRTAAAHIGQTHRHIDILVNNAGVFFEEDRARPCTALDPLVVRRTFAVNAMGAIHVTNAFLHLIPRGGRIINVSSVMGLESHKADGRGMAYRMSKAALNSFTRSLAAELEPRGIMVDAFHPGWVKTALGGPDAKDDVEKSVETAFFLAVRPPSRTSGVFWDQCGVVQ